MKPSEILDKAADLIEPEGAWTQGTYGRDASGIGVGRPRDAVCFCPVGAMLAAKGHIHFGHRLEGRSGRYMSHVIGGGIIPDWNDDPARTQAEVVTALRQAAELARKDGQ